VCKLFSMHLLEVFCLVFVSFPLVLRHHGISHIVAISRSNVDKPPFHFTVLHLEVIGDSCGHFFNLYISLHLDDKFDFFPNAYTLTYVVDPCNEVFIFVTSPLPPLVPNPSFHFNLDDVAFTSSPLLQVKCAFRKCL